MSLRSYHTENRSHVHDFAQLVLPISGSMALEAGHYTGVVNNDIGVYIAPNEQHCFAGSQNNLFLVIDVNAGHFLNECPKSNALTLSTNIKQFIPFIHHYLVQ